MTATIEKSDKQWITANDAWNLAVDLGQNPVSFEGAVAQLLRSGRLTAKAAGIWTSREVSINRSVDNMETAPDFQRDVIVPVNYWRSSICPSADREKWRWQKSTFVYTVSRDMKKRRFFRHVSFDRKQIELFLKNLSQPTKEKSPRGPSVDEQNIYNGWLEVLRVALSDGGIKSNRFKSAAALQSCILKRIQDADGNSKPGTMRVRSITAAAHKLVKKLEAGEENPYNLGRDTDLAPSE